MAFLLPLLQILPTIIGVAQAVGIVKTSTGVEVSTIAADAATLAAGGATTPTAVANITQLLTDVKTQGVVSGSAMDQALNVAQVVNDYTSGQVAVLDSNFTALGIPGDVFAIAKTSTNEAAIAFRTAAGL
jgi:hypothetical protein